MSWSRRGFLGRTGGGLLGSVMGFERLLATSAAEVTLAPDRVQFSSEIEPLVRLIEDTPREKCIEVLAERARAGMTYEELLAALFLAGIRNVNPQPPGFTFHCVFVIHSVHFLNQMSPPRERLLSLFWVLDYFKQSQARDVSSGDFELLRLEGSLLTAEEAWPELHSAMAEWDESRADRAVTSLARTVEPQKIFEELWEYGARDYRNIGHKAIFVAHAWRTLQTIGWQHSEPTLRSLVRGLLDFGRGRRVNEYAFEDQSYLANRGRARESATHLEAGWDGSASIDAALAKR